VQIVGYINTNKDYLHGQKWNSADVLRITVDFLPEDGINNTETDRGRNKRVIW